MFQMAASGSDPLELKENPEADPLSVAKNIALRHLSMAPKSRFQLEQVLAKKGVSPEIAKLCLDRLTEVGLIDDLANAGMFVRSKCVSKKISRSVLRMELRQKGITDEHIEQALTQITDDDEYQMANILSFLDVGPYHCNTFSGSSINDIREYVELVRRLTIPYYEEARMYWQEALDDGYFTDANEIWIYGTKTLKHLIEEYGR